MYNSGGPLGRCEGGVGRRRRRRRCCRFFFAATAAVLITAAKSSSGLVVVGRSRNQRRTTTLAVRRVVAGRAVVPASSGSSYAFAFVGSERRGSLQGRTMTSALRSTGGDYLDNLSCVAPAPSYASSVRPFASPSTSSYDAASSSSTGVLGPLRSAPILGLEHADAIATKVVECCVRNKFNPVVVHVLDSAGCILVTKRMDGCSAVGASDFAYAKAYACVVNNDSSRAFREKYTSQQESAKFGQMLAMVRSKVDILLF